MVVVHLSGALLGGGCRAGKARYAGADCPGLGHSINDALTVFVFVQRRVGATPVRRAIATVY